MEHAVLVYLYKIKVLSPVGLARLLTAVWKHGINMLALLEYAAQTYRDQVALADEQETISYKQLLVQSEQLAYQLQQQHRIRSGQRVAFICRNHVCLVRSIFAMSRLGADIYLLNAEMSTAQLHMLMERYDFHFIVYDEEQTSKLEQLNDTKDKLLSYHDERPSISGLLNVQSQEIPKLPRASSGKLMLLTGGTTGIPKAATHRPSLSQYMSPFVALIDRLKLQQYRTVYMATPIYHGYGVGMCMLFIALGKKVIIRKGFDAETACALIQEHQVEVVTVVPLMLHKMLKHDLNRLTSLACVASGSVPLNPKLIEEARNLLGNVVYNLYGTSETGLNMIATPQDLESSPTTIGKVIEGIRLSILDDQKIKVGSGMVGQLFICTSAVRRNAADSWIETGDMVRRDDNGYYYLCGRVDDMVVSGGANVYPIEVEQVLIGHPQVEDVAVIGVHDEHFDQRLKAFVLTKQNTSLTQAELLQWLRPRVARYQMPREVTFVERMPYTPIGKLDKKQLNNHFT